MDLQIWDVWQAVVPYSDKPGKSSVRPVVILSATEVLVLKMTTHQHSEVPKPYEYELFKWQDAGLTSKTFVQCDRVIRLLPENFTGKRYGRLAMTDIIGIRTLMRYHGTLIK